MLASGDVAGAAAAGAAAITAARSLAFSFPMALCLETAALVLLRTGAPAEAIGRLLAAAQAIRERGDRPGPVTLSVAVAQARIANGTELLAPSDPTETAGLAATLLRDLAGAPSARPLVPPR
jgi:hypothetical protein